MNRKRPERAKQATPPPESGDSGADDVLETFLAGQSRKCAAHHRAQTSEVLELIRKHRKPRDGLE